VRNAPHGGLGARPWVQVGGQEQLLRGGELVLEAGERLQRGEATRQYAHEKKKKKLVEESPKYF